MGVPVYKRILDLFEAEGVNTLFGIPDPNFVHMFSEADARGWSVVAPHHELSAGFMAEAASRMTGQAGALHRHARPGGRQHRRGDDVRAMWRTRRSSSSAVSGPASPSGGCVAAASSSSSRRPFHPVGEVQQLDRVRRPDRRDRPRGDPPRDVRHPGSVLHRVPVPCDPRGARCAGSVAAEPVSTGQPGRGCARGRRGREADPRRQEPDPAGRPRRSYLAHRRVGQGTRRPHGLPGDPDIRRHVVHPRARGPHVRLRLLARGRRSGGRLRPVRRAGHRTRRAEPLRQDAALGRERRRPQMGSGRTGSGGDRRQPADRRTPGRRPARRRAATRRGAPGKSQTALRRPGPLDHPGRRGTSGAGRFGADRQDAGAPGALRRRSHQGFSPCRKTASWCATAAPRSFSVDLLAGQTARRDLEPELRPPRHRACPTPSAPPSPRAASARSCC